MTWDGENRLVKLERPAWTQPTGGFMAPANPQGIPPNELPAMTIEFKYDGLSRLVERKVTRGIDAPEVEGYQWDGWKLIMIAKLNTDGTFHSRKWSCVWRPDVGSSLYARTDWMRAGGVGGVAWMQTGAVQSYSYGTGSGEVHVPLADHMGNVRHYYQFKATKGKVIGQLVASYEYDAFGREVRAWGLNTPTENQPPGLPASRPWADHLPFHYSSKLRDVDSGFNYYGYRFYDPGAGRWLSRDPMGEQGGDNLYGFNYNMPTGLVDVLGREPAPVDSGSWVPASDSSETAHFREVSDATSDPGHSSQANSGLDMIKRLKEDSKNNCCVKNYTIAGHGWRSDLADDGKSVRPRGRGIPGNQKGPDGVGLYVNDNYPGMDKTRGGASLDDIAREIKSGGIKFCRPCTISIHSCYIDDSFISKLRDITKCTVVAAGGKCDGGAGGRPWRSGPTDHPKDDRRTPQNGFRRAGMGKTVVLPTVPIGPKYTPPAP